MKLAKFLRTPYFTEHFQWLLLIVSAFQLPASLLKTRFPQRYFSVTFAKFLRTSFDRALPDNCVLSLCVNFWEVFQNIFYTAPLRNGLFHVQVVVFQPADTVKNYFTSAIEAFYIRTRSSHSTAFIYLKSLKN